jgi:murein DD-endopeptidase MepM/ murein hydrolase activator NlpD
VVDTLDFPLDPPEAHDVFGGQDFGVFRSRFDGYHTGEDWWRRRGLSSFGTPVYSIGHGTVTYAAPLGWGADKGVVIVRHVFADSSTILSFYGHLDPPSVVLNVGDCVARGEQVGEIGRPRTPPHLHFEIRSHTPNAPGPGYWSSDPTLAGWEPPSQYIWEHRISTSPGVAWMRPFAAWGSQGLGRLGHDTFAVIENGQLIGVNLLDGSSRWSLPDSSRVYSAMVDAQGALVYVCRRFGRIEAFRLPDLQGDDPSAVTELSEPLWEIKLEVSGIPTFMPLPGGGVVVAGRQEMFGVSAAGALLWEQEVIMRPFDWALAGDQLILAMVGGDATMWTVTASGPPLAWPVQIEGHPVVVGDQVWVYHENGIYRLDTETFSAELLYALPKAIFWWGDIVALSDGGVLVAHADAFDRRLIVLNADGTLRWERSYAQLGWGQQQLLTLDGRAYLLSQESTTSYSDVSLLAIDLDSARLTRIFSGGTRYPLASDTWASALDDGRILLNIGGGYMIALDPQLAFEAVSH